MVMVTRSAYRKATESLNSSDISQNNIIGVPPWCSSGKVYERRKPRRVLPTWEATSYPLRENIWEYLHDKSRYFDENRTKKVKQKVKGKCSTQKLMTLLIFIFIGLGLIVPLWAPEKIPKTELLKSILPDIKLFSFVGFPSSSVSEECCHRLRHLTLLLSRIEQELRKTLKVRRKFMISSPNIETKKTISNVPRKRLIHGAKATIGSGTKEWGTQVALWGVVPLWRTALSPDTILALKQPKPSDCWPFSGSYGEVIIELPRKMFTNSLSLEHVRPDTARSAPKIFIVYGVLENGTYVKAADGMYSYNKPAKQYYSLNNGNAPLKRIVFRVLSNQGNPKYTCIYRVHVYKTDDNRIIH
ncbi:uncharacterized protein [Epargyreus clarus]|uniref:uncharacterized protein n=1 Tax=Epargyreus clarus TaxID=520877 RepID=UPI003C2E11A4